MNKYQLLALDMDGTVLDDQQKISDVNRSAIQDAISAGITVMFATGRGVQSVESYIEEMGLSAPMITVNGGEIWLSPGKLYKRELLTVEWVDYLHALSVEHDLWYWAYAVEGLFDRNNWTNDTASIEWLKFGVHTVDLDKLAKIQATLMERKTFEITNSHPTNLEINRLGTSKASGLRTVCELLGISMSQVIAVGDSMNDIQMIRSAGLGIAMGNAQEAVKQAADFITGTNLEDGVSQVIRTFVTREKAISE